MVWLQGRSHEWLTSVEYRGCRSKGGLTESKHKGTVEVGAIWSKAQQSFLTELLT